MGKSSLMMGIYGVLACAGCGLMNVPMITRLEPEAQKEADGMWHNMLTPSDRVDRESLLGTLTWYQLYQAGVDRADYHAEKIVDDKRVAMDVHFQKDRPQDDAFYFTVYGAGGALIRSERFSRADLDRLRQELNVSYPHDQPLTAEQQAAKDRFEARRRAIQAATQPASPMTTQPAIPPKP